MMILAFLVFLTLFESIPSIAADLMNTVPLTRGYALFLIGDSTQRYWLDEGISQELHCRKPSDDPDAEIIGRRGFAVFLYRICDDELLRRVGFQHHWGVSYAAFSILVKRGNDNVIGLTLPTTYLHRTSVARISRIPL